MTTTTMQDTESRPVEPDIMQMTIEPMARLLKRHAYRAGEAQTAEQWEELAILATLVHEKLMTWYGDHEFGPLFNLDRIVMDILAEIQALSACAAMACIGRGGQFNMATDTLLDRPLYGSAASFIAGDLHDRCTGEDVLAEWEAAFEGDQATMMSE